MLRLHQTFGAHAGRSREFDQDVVRIGRLPTSDLAFDAHADLDASGSHAEIRREAAQWVLVDVGSRNGTLVRGKTVQRHVLVDGDEVEFGTGGPRVRVEIVGGVASAPPLRAIAPPPPFGATAPAPALAAMPPSFGSAPVSRLPSAPAPLVHEPTRLPAPAAGASSSSSSIWMIITIVALFGLLAMCLLSCVLFAWLYRLGVFAP